MGLAPESSVALLRRPGPELERCILTHLPRVPIDVQRARDQHQAWMDALKGARVEVRILPRMPDDPDATFVEDAAVVLEDVAILPRLGDERRRAERASLAEALAAERELLRLEAPTTLDGGDVLAIDDVVYVGQSRRTNHAALKALAHALFERGYLVKAVEVSGALHLKTACTHLGDDRVLANTRHVGLSRLRGLEVVEVHPDEPFAANVVRLGDTLWMSASHPRTRDTLAHLGYRVRTLDISEFEKAEAGLSCLAVLFQRANR